MTRAPLAQQRQLIALQELDTALARHIHERGHLPVLARIEATVERLKANKRQAVLAAADLAEASKEAARREEEVAQVTRRASVMRERLTASGTAARDLSAIQGELDQLGRRQEVLEEAQLEAMDALEAAQKAAHDLEAEEAQIRAEGREMTAERDAEFARLDAEIEKLRAKRQEMAAQFAPELLDEYEATRRATGGLGVVALYGRRVEGGAVEISPQEFARIAAADPDEILHSEDTDVILVRMED